MMMQYNYTLVTSFLIQFYGEQHQGIGAFTTVGTTYTVNLEPSCTQVDKLSPGEMGQCTLLISSFNLRAFTSGATTTVCTLPTPSLPVVSTSSLPVVSTSSLPVVRTSSLPVVRTSSLPVVRTSLHSGT